MSGEKKYLRRADLGIFWELAPPLLELLRQHLDRAGLPYEVLDAPPEPKEQGEEQPTRRRRSS
jgi:hypothetical protein